MLKILRPGRSRLFGFNSDCRFLFLVVYLSCCVQVYWRHAAGDLDRYVVLIRYNHSVLQNKSVSAGFNECVFSSLTPGRLYTVAVETWSGDYVSSASTDGRTCESESRAASRALMFFFVLFFFLIDSIILSLVSLFLRQSQQLLGICRSATQEQVT